MPKWLRDYVVGIAVLVTYGIASFLATAYQGALKQAQHAHAKLTPAQSYIGSLSPWVVLAVLAVVLILGLAAVAKIEVENGPQKRCPNANNSRMTSRLMPPVTW